MILTVLLWVYITFYVMSRGPLLAFTVWMHCSRHNSEGWKPRLLHLFVMVTLIPLVGDLLMTWLIMAEPSDTVSDTEILEGG